MLIFAALQRSGGVQALAERLGLNPAEATAAARYLVPIVIAGFRHMADQWGGDKAGIAKLLAFFDSLGGADLASAILKRDPLDPDTQTVLLNHLFRGDDFLNVLEAAHAHTGVEISDLREMVPKLAMLAAGYIAARAAAINGLAPDCNLVQELLENSANDADANGGIVGGIGPLLDVSTSDNPLVDFMLNRSKPGS